MPYFEVRECRRYFNVRNLEVLKAIQPRMQEGLIAREIQICSNSRGRDRARRFEFARMWEEEILREILFRSNAGGRDRVRRLEFAQI